jgi:hypothetical protein
MIDISDLIETARRIVAMAEIAPGRYQRYAGTPAGDSVDNPYGCADAANILYTLDAFPREAQERQAFVDTLNAMQQPDGLWREDTHHPIHTTAHCIAALELFDAGSARPLEALADLRDPARMEAFLDALAWRENPWRASHQGAGLHTALTLSGEATREWRNVYIAWLARNADPETGFWRRGAMGPVEHDGTYTLFPHLAGSFHYLFAMQYERAPLAYPERMIDSCLSLFADDVFPLGRAVGFAEIDWVYCLNRASRQTPHRFDERTQALKTFAGKYVDYLRSIDPDDEPTIRDLHLLFGVLCALAELQAALPGFLQTERPLRLVLDRRPFI